MLTDNNHNASHKSQQTSNNPPETPVTTEHESDKKEDKQHTSSKLEVHLLVLFIELRQTSRRELLANPRITQNHEQTAHDGQVAQEEVEIEDESIANSLQNDNGHEARDAEFGVFAEDDAEGANQHEDDVCDEEEMRYAVPDCRRGDRVSSPSTRGGEVWGSRTMAVVVEVCELISPLRDDSKRIFEESNDDEEATNAREVSSIGRELAMFSDSPSPRGGRCACV